MPDHDYRASREIKELSLLFEISKKLSEALDLNTVLKPILQMMADNMEMLRGTLTILNRSRGEIFIEEAYGLLPEEQAKGKYRLGEGITGQVIDTGRLAIIPRISEEPRFLDRTGARKNIDKSDVTFICVPIKIGNEVIGALSLDRPFDENVSFADDVRLLTIIASSISQAVRLRQLVQEELEKVREENQRLHDELKIKYGKKTIIGNSKSMIEIFALIDKVSRTNTTVLILGESGVGKERVAHAIHYNSSRVNKPYIEVNCAALPENLIESELFGHEKGAFTGATSFHKGRFEMAEGGTIFLDEIGELSLALQAKLLRVLQEKTFERVGGNATIKAEVRIIAATNRNLEKLIQEGKFREDLYYRLNAFPIVVPPLRERKTDIILLADYFTEKYSREFRKNVSGISAPAIDLLMNHHWPGNVRELENCIERAIILCTDGIIHGHHLPPSIKRDDTGSRKKFRGKLNEILAAIEIELLLEELRRSYGNMARAARSLGITERTIGLRIAKYGIDINSLKNNPTSM
jgi:Nif-specific regulatory protein